MMEYEFDELVRPIPVGPDWWSSIKRFPVKIIDQSFGYELQTTDMINPKQVSDVTAWPRTQDRITKTGHSWVILDLKGFQLELSIPEFANDEIDVCFEKGFLIVHGEHQERKEGEGTTIRSFTRRYMLPCECEQDPVDCEPSFEGNVMTIRIPRKRVDNSTQVSDELIK